MGFHSASRVTPAPLAPAPTSTLLGAPTPPAGATESTATATLAARQAAQKQRRRAGGSLLTATTAPHTPAVPAVTHPRTLVGY